MLFLKVPSRRNMDSQLLQPHSATQACSRFPSRLACTHRGLETPRRTVQAQCSPRRIETSLASSSFSQFTLRFEQVFNSQHTYCGRREQNARPFTLNVMIVSNKTFSISVAQAGPNVCLCGVAVVVVHRVTCQ